MTEFRLAAAIIAALFASQCVWANSAVEPIERTGRSYKRFEALNERVAERSPRVIILGDSITHFWEVTGRELWMQNIAPYDAVNLGISGDRTEHVIWRLQNGNIDGINPEAAVVMIGTNNLNRNSAEEIAEGVIRIVEILHARFPEMKILLYGIFPRANIDREFLNRIPAINTILANSEWPQQVRFHDIGEHFLDENGVVQREIMFDFLHLTRKGYEIWAEDLREQLPKLLSDDTADAN